MHRLTELSLISNKQLPLMAICRFAAKHKPSTNCHQLNGIRTTTTSSNQPESNCVRRREALQDKTRSLIRFPRNRDLCSGMHNYGDSNAAMCLTAKQ